MEIFDYSQQFGDIANNDDDGNSYDITEVFSIASERYYEGEKVNWKKVILKMKKLIKTNDINRDTKNEFKALINDFIEEFRDEFEDND